MKYYIKMIDTRIGKTYYKAYKCSEGWRDERLKERCWAFSKQGAKKIISKLEWCRDINKTYAQGIIWEMEEA